MNPSLENGKNATIVFWSRCGRCVTKNNTDAVVERLNYCNPRCVLKQQLFHERLIKKSETRPVTLSEGIHKGTLLACFIFPASLHLPRLPAPTPSCSCQSPQLCKRNKIMQNTLSLRTCLPLERTYFYGKFWIAVYDDVLHVWSFPP